MKFRWIDGPALGAAMTVTTVTAQEKGHLLRELGKDIPGRHLAAAGR